MKSEYSDILTELPNLILFHNMIDDLITQNSEIDRYAIACIGIENLRELNETFGYRMGDEAIKYVADYLDNFYFTARIAEDKFAILIMDIESSKHLLETMEELIGTIRFASSNKNEQCYISLNAGIAIYPDNGRNVATLLQDAETALYLSREKGEILQLYKNELQEEIINKVQLINMIQFSQSRRTIRKL